MAKSSKIGGIYAELFIKDMKFRQGLKAANMSLGKFATNAAKVGVKAAGALAAISGAAITAGIVKSVNAASDMSETLSKSDAVFGESSASMQAWAKTAAKSFGQSNADALESASSIGNMFKAMGLGEDQIANMSRSMVELGGDLASFNNTSPEDAIQALGAALRGESEPIRRYGVLLDDATLKAKALAMGLYEGKGSLTPATRAMAAYQVILEQTKTAQGDFAKTSDGLANSQRIITAEISDMAAAIGEGLLPSVTELVGKLKQVDFTGIGENIGDSLADALSVLTSGNAWKIFTLHGEAALLELQSDKINSWFATMANTVWEGVTDGRGFDFDESWKKFETAGQEATAELLLDKYREINRLQDEIFSEKQGPALPPWWNDKLLGPDLPSLTPGDGATKSIIPDIKKATIEPEKLDVDTARAGVNSMQARGLAQGAIADRKKEDKTLGVLEKMLAVLEDARTGGELVFR